MIMPAGLSACSGVARGLPDYSPAPNVSRAETLAIAESYRKHSWVPTDRNVFHGQDRRGIRVDTPDVSWRGPDAIRPGWWTVGEVNVGVPYQWGGFDTPATFSKKLAKGFYAGDVYSEEKREGLYAAISKDACGVDCSGFISRCWRLDRAYSTRELPMLCEPLQDYRDLRPGDILNKHNVHALLFARFTNEAKSELLAYEAGSPPSWKVLAHPIPANYLKGKGYKPYRYRGIRED
ncbi:MAG TPA: hypothetical protein VMN36_00345 [Verrucomicrobiales bacterium]|nr:hypothetical protein [Verrucomicrobiales bacterium]